MSHQIDSKYHLGFNILAAYRIPCSSLDIMATWTHFGRNLDSHILDQPFQTQVILPAPVGEIIGPIPVSGKIQTHIETQAQLDDVQLTLGQHVNFGPRLQLRFSAGARYADLKRELNIFKHSIAVGSISGTIDSSSSRISGCRNGWPWRRGISMTKASTTSSRS